MIMHNCVITDISVRVSISVGSSAGISKILIIKFSYLLTLKAPNKNCSRRHFNFLLLSFEENKI